ncbi:unnamed protein product [Urochloa decumbens]|uniref:non-specific serine/threonine protein kinase n=1 Tax=Urochloa decumbens TaxID=240449 RepID=A0ABC9AHS3_9POAL
MASASSPTLFSLTFIICLYCFFVLCLHVPSSSSVSFSYNFSMYASTEDNPCGHDIVCYQDAEFVRSTSAIELTKNQQTGNITDNKGRIWYRHPVPLWSESTGEVTSFTTSFSFNITPIYSSQYPKCKNWISPSGDGMTFFLASWPESSDGVVLANATDGGDLNIFNPSNHFNATGDSRVVAVEFDTFFGYNTWDIHGQHIGIDVNSIVSVAYAITPGMNNLTSPFTKAALVRYNNSTKMLTADVQIGNTSYYVNANVDLKQSLPGTVAVGFSASTGACVEIHELLSWSFNSTLELQAKEDHQSTKLLVRVLVPVTSVVLLVCAGVGLLIWKRRRTRNARAYQQGTKSEESDEQNDGESELEMGVAGPRRYHYHDLAAATGEFAADNLLGQGGFGSVYRGHLPSYDGQQQQVAIKKFSSESSSQSRKEFEAEVRIIGRLRHRNLVQLLGWCDSRKALLLVYELVPEGSLDKHIYSDTRVLTWPERYNIILGLGSALHYLHRDWEQRVVHGDIKPSNIMLDSSYNAKLGDFGLARLGDHGAGPQTTDLVKGTMGYIDPEFVNTHRRSTESDVYSFGIVLLEIVSGRAPVNRLDPSFSLLRWVQSLYCQGELRDAADARLRGDADADDEAHLRQMERALVVGLWCTQRDPGERPSITVAMRVLQSEHYKLPVLSLHMYNYKPAGVASTGDDCGVSGTSFSSGIRSAAAVNITTSSSESFADLPVLPHNSTW